MIEVTHDEFFAALKADKRDIMPTYADPEHTSWLILSTREVFGVSYPGWRSSQVPKRYLLTPAAYEYVANLVAKQLTS